MKKAWIIAGTIVSIFFAVACGNDTKPTTPATTEPSASTDDDTEDDEAVASDPKGLGKYTNVELTNPLDEKLVAVGQETYDVKCASCHKLTDERLVGPGWKDVTKRRTPEWIMNFSTNTEEMLDKDAAAMSMLEICLVRMPNQNLSDTEARGVLEFMRKNDGEK